MRKSRFQHTLGVLSCAAVIGCSKGPPTGAGVSPPDSVAASLRSFVIAHLPAADSALRRVGFTLRGNDALGPIGLSPAAVFILPSDSVDSRAQLFIGEVDLSTYRLGQTDMWHYSGGPVKLTFAGRGRAWWLLTEDGYLLPYRSDSTLGTVHLDVQSSFRQAFPQQAEMIDWSLAKKAVLDSLGLRRPQTHRNSLP